MKFRVNRSEEPELNLVPLIDVLLMTLIFLVVTTSFSKETQLRIRLPEASATAKINDNSVRVLIDAQGHFYIGDQQLASSSVEALRAAIARAAGNIKDPVIVIHADGRTPHEAVVHVMDAARRLGYTRITFATQKPASDASP
ncbi:MAG: biopolymer transporter ExbD [Acidiferrobacteraceae bacterium]|jgi:biopolymer transport protein ExbD